MIWYEVWKLFSIVVELCGSYCLNSNKLFTPFRSVDLFVDELTKDGTKNDYMATMTTKGQLARTRCIGRHKGMADWLEQGFGNRSAATSFAKSN